MKLAALILAGCLWLASSAWAVSWRRPVHGPLLRSFALSADRYARGQHRGVDLGAPPGAAVLAACGGRVRFAGRVPGGGRTVSVSCGALVATYQHLDEVAVRRGTVVVPGGAIGTVGRSGLAPGVPAHLHLGARETASGRYVDPLTLFAGARRPAPLVPRARRRVPLGPAPRPALRPAPAPASRPVAAARPIAAAPVAAPEPPGAPVARTPLVAWIGLVALGLGLPFGGLVTRRRRRRAREGVGAGAQVA